MEKRSSNLGWLIALGVAVMTLAGWWLQARGRGERTSLALEHITPAERPAGSSSPRELVEPVAEDARVPAPESEEGPEAARLHPGLRFVYDDGTPAAKVGLYPAYVASMRTESAIEHSTPNLVVQAKDASGQIVGVPLKSLESFDFDLGLRSESPMWIIHTDTDGAITSRDAEVLAPIAAARMSADAVVVLPINPAQSDRHVLPSVVSQAVALGQMAPTEAVAIEAVLRSSDLYLFLHGEDDDPRRPFHAFADQNLVLARALDSPRVVAWRVLRLSTTAPLERLDLPKGSYELVARTCTFGWWVRPVVFEAGAPVVLDVYRTPVAQLSCFDPRTDALMIPKLVRLYILQESSSAEVDVPWELRGNDIFVAVTQGDPKPDHRYAVKVTWSTGEEWLTDMVRWESLHGLLHFKVE